MKVLTLYGNGDRLSTNCDRPSINCVVYRRRHRPCIRCYCKEY
ncbi:MAG: hypothetical protein V7L20_05845 [Nostoc sp.]